MFKFKMRISSAALAPRASLHGKHSRTCWTLPVTSCSCPCTSSHMDGTIRQGFNPLCQIPTTRAAMTSPCASKTNLAVRGVHHASTCALPVRNLRRALCEQNTRAGHVGFHTPARVENLSSPEFSYPAWLLSVAGSATFTAHVSGPGFTPASEHVAVSCAARPEPRARRRVNPARFPFQLRPLLGPCLLSDAVVVSIRPTHTCVTRHSHTTPLH